MENNDLVRELYKIMDTLTIVEQHFSHEAKMNAALHMSSSVRPAPLAAAVSTALSSLDRIVGRLENDG